MKFASGDLLFLDEREGPLSAAIADVTCRQFGVSGPSLSHAGVVFHEGPFELILEARAQVRSIAADEFLGLAKHACSTTRGWYWARLKPDRRALIPEALEWIRRRMGAPYDATYGSAANSYSCAQLIAEAFRAANQGEPLFALRPMFFGNPEDSRDPSWKTWSEHFQKLGIPVPREEPGVSPLALYLSENADRLR